MKSNNVITLQAAKLPSKNFMTRRRVQIAQAAPLPKYQATMNYKL